MQLLNSSHVRERDKDLLGRCAGWWGLEWFPIGEGARTACAMPVLWCPDSDGHLLFWECSFPPLVEIRDDPEFHDLMRMDKGHWPKSLLWHGWLPLLSGANDASPWAGAAAQGAGHMLEQALWGLLFAVGL